MEPHETAPTPGQLFFDTFTDPIVASLVAALKRAYDTVCEGHEPSRGFNEQTFGYCLYHVAAHELETEAMGLGPEVEVEAGRPLFRLRVGEYLLGCHRVGHRAIQDITRCFPGNDGAAPALIETQLWLPGMEPRLERARNLVLAHLGNTEEGLVAVYLCVPSREEKDKIAEWGFTHLLWSVGETLATKPTPMTMPVEPEEVIDEPTIRRKQREEGA